MVEGDVLQYPPHSPIWNTSGELPQGGTCSLLTSEQDTPLLLLPFTGGRDPGVTVLEMFVDMLICIGGTSVRSAAWKLVIL